MARFYLAGPMRGIPHCNFPAFDEAAAAGRALGFEVISPAEIDREHGFNGDNTELLDDEFMRACFMRDVLAIWSLRPREGDGIALLPGWERSVGGMAEIFLGRFLGVSFVDARTWQPFKLTDFFHIDTRQIITALMDALCGRTPTK